MSGRDEDVIEVPDETEESGPDKLIRTAYPGYMIFVAVVAKASVNPRGYVPYQRKPDGPAQIVDEDVIERICESDEVEIRRINRRFLLIPDELPIVAGEVTQ